MPSSSARAAALVAAAAIAACTPAVATATPGGPWYPSTAGVLALDASTWLATTDRGTFRTADAGATWTRTGDADGSIDQSQGTVVAVAAAFSGSTSDPAYGASTLYTSSDQGVSFTARALSIPRVVRVALDPTGASRMLALTDGGALHRSADSGASWASAGTVDSGQVGFSGAGTAFITDHAQRLERSTNGGATWTAIARPTQITAIYAMAPGAGHSITILGPAANGSCPAVSSGLGHPRTQSLYRVMTSSNAGDTWTAGGTTCMYGMGWSAGWQPVLAVSGTTVSVLTDSGTAAISTDGGQTFTEHTAPAFMSQQRAWSGTGNDIVLATGAGVGRVADGHLTQPAGAGLTSWTFFAGTAARGSTLIATNTGQNLLVRSTDGGESWTTTGGAILGVARESSGISIRPPGFDPGTGVAVFGMDAYGATPGTLGMQIIRSGDGGATWTAGAAVDNWEASGAPSWGGGAGYMPVRQPYVEGHFTATACAVARSTDDFATATVTPITVGGVAPQCWGLHQVVVAPDDPKVLFAIGQMRSSSAAPDAKYEMKYFRSTDGGASWSVPAGLGSAFVNHSNLPTVAFSPTTPGAAVLSNRRAMTVCTSTDDGASFTCAIPAFLEGTLSSMDYQRDGSLIASYVSGAWPWQQEFPPADLPITFARSVDNGGTWATSAALTLPSVQEVSDLDAGGAIANELAPPFGLTGQRPHAAASPGGTRALLLSTAGIVRRAVAFTTIARTRKATFSKKKVALTKRTGMFRMSATCAPGKSCAGTVTVTVTAARCGARACTPAVRRKALKIALPARTAFNIAGARGARPVRVSVTPAMRRNIPAVGTVLTVRITIRQAGMGAQVLRTTTTVVP